jgi:hypothetical protein
MLKLKTTAAGRTFTADNTTLLDGVQLNTLIPAVANKANKQATATALR